MMAIIPKPSRRKDGCVECKRKKVQCDLKRPVCGRCLPYPRECKYELRLVDMSQKAASSRKVLRNSTLRSRLVIPSSHLQQPTLIPSRYLSNSHSRFYLHHFATQTAIVSFPAVDPRFKEQLVSIALDVPHLLHALLAAASSQYSRLLGTTSHTDAMATTLKYTNRAISTLQMAINDPVQLNKVETVLATMMLCTNDVCSGNTATSKTHLSGTARILSSFFSQQLAVNSNSNALFRFLARWFATMQIATRVSTFGTDNQTGEQLWLFDHSLLPRSYYIDDVCGYSLRLMPILARLVDLAETRGIENAENSGYETSGHFQEIAEIEEQIISLMPSVAQPSTISGRASELFSCNLAFVHATLLFLHRHVQLLPATHFKVIRDLAQIVDAIASIPLFSTTNILALWPVFSIGCETLDLDQRDFVKIRMLAMRTYGVGNFSRADKMLHDYWASGSGLSWNAYRVQHNLGLVLF